MSLRPGHSLLHDDVPQGVAQSVALVTELKRSCCRRGAWKLHKCQLGLSTFSACDSGSVAHTRNNLVSSSSSSSAACSPFCDSCASSMTVSSPFSFDISAFCGDAEICREMRSRAYIDVAVFFCEPADQYA